MRNSLVPHVLEAAPREESFIEAVKDDALEGFKTFNEAAFAGAIVADENGEGGELDHAAVAHGLEMAESEALQRQLKLRVGVDLFHFARFVRFHGRR